MCLELDSLINLQAVLLDCSPAILNVSSYDLVTDSTLYASLSNLRSHEAHLFAILYGLLVEEYDATKCRELFASSSSLRDTSRKHYKASLARSGLDAIEYSRHNCTLGSCRDEWICLWT
jgi:hypothetical protein